MSRKTDSRFNYTFLNIGRTAAVLTEHFDRFDFGRNLPSPIDPNGSVRTAAAQFPSGVISAPNYMGQNFWTNTFVLEAAEEWNGFSRPSSERINLYVSGYVRYRDVFGQHHIMGDSAIFDTTGGRFVLRGDSRYNYEREEAESAEAPLSSNAST